MYRDCPHRGEKVRIVHNVPRIYKSLDNKQVELQSHMIEVEGKINKQTIVILIDSKDSHSYIDPNMVERLHFP
jgi:hypothetical protein